MSISRTPTARSPQSRRLRNLTAGELERRGLLQVDQNAVISRFAVFVPDDHVGAADQIVVGSGAVVEPFAVIHGGTTIGEQARVEEHAVVGKPELGYAVDGIHSGAGARTSIGPGAVVRSGAIVYSGVRVGADTVIGHHTLLRTAVRVGEHTQLGHHLTVERTTWIGRDVRCSPGSHLTAECVLADGVFLGAGVRTVNDKTLTWRDPNRKPTLIAPRFDADAKVGSGSVVLAGVTIGERALVGAGSVVTHDIPPDTVSYGHPARVRSGAR